MTEQWAYNEVPTPVNNDDYIKLANDLINKHQEWLIGTSFNGWELLSKENGIQIDELKIPEISDISVVRASMTMCNVKMRN